MRGVPCFGHGPVVESEAGKSRSIFIIMSSRRFGFWEPDDRRVGLEQQVLQHALVYDKKYDQFNERYTGCAEYHALVTDRQ